MLKDIEDLIWKKSIEAFRFYEVLNFSKKARFYSTFREIKVLSQIVFHNCGLNLDSLVFTFGWNRRIGSNFIGILRDVLNLAKILYTNESNKDV